MKKVLLFLSLLCCAIMSCVSSNGEEPPFRPVIMLRSEAMSFTSEGGTQQVQVLANVEYEMTPSADWITAKKGSNMMVSITAAPSKVASERSGELVISNKEYNLTQSIKVSQKAYVAPFNTKGWAEMPAEVGDVNLEYGYHYKLPSNNKLRNYSFCFDKEKHCALWVAYPLHDAYIGSSDRTDRWEYDPCCIDDEYEPFLKNAYYPHKGSEYSHSRGHQLPSADRTASADDNLTTFYFTNATPQLQSLNGGTWMSLEGDLRSKWMCKDTLYVVTGAHFADGYGYAYDNKGEGKACAVPTHYYKVILRTKSGDSGKWVGSCSADELKCVGFWFEHKGGAARQMKSVAEIERLTGHTFFTNVPNAPKAAYNASEW